MLPNLDAYDMADVRDDEASAYGDDARDALDHWRDSRRLVDLDAAEDYPQAA